MIAPPGVLIVEGFLRPALCEDWRAFIDAQSTHSLWVQDTESYIESSEVKFEYHEGRMSETIDLAEYKTDVLREVVRGYRDYVTRFFRADLDTIEPLSVLKYGPGGR